MKRKLTTTLPDTFMTFIGGKDTPAPVKQIYKSLYKFAASDARQNWLDQGKQCKDAAWENEFFTTQEKADMRKVGQEPHVVNKLVTGVQGASAIATANRPDIKVFPLRESDPYLAELIKNALEHVWLRNYGNDVVYDVVEERNTTGLGCIYAKLDMNKGPTGAVVFEEDDATLWYWDDESKKRDRSDTHLIKAQLRSVPYIKAHYPRLKDEDIVAVNDKFDDEIKDKPDTVSGVDNYTIEPKTHEPNQETEKRMVWEIEAYLLRTEREMWGVLVDDDGSPSVARFPDAKTVKDAQAEISRLKSDKNSPIDSGEPWPRILNNRYKVIVVGDKIISQTDPRTGDDVDELLNPLGVDSDGDPVLPVVFYFAQRTAKAYYRAPTFYAFDANKSLCKREIQYTHAVGKNLTAPVVREEHGTRWADTARPDAPGNELLISKSSRMPDRLNPGLVDLAALTARIVEDKSNIDEAYGLPEVLKGKIPQGLERMSGRLGLALQDTGTIMQNPSIRGLESCLERLGKLLLALILGSWPPYKWEALVTEERVQDFRPPTDPVNAIPDDEKTDEMKEDDRLQRMESWAAAIQKVTTQGMSVVDFNIAITAGSSLPTNRLLKEETAIEKYKIGLYDRQAALEYSGDPHAKEIASRMDKREMMMAQTKGGK